MRILAEYFEPQQRFDELRVRDTIVFFGSARILSREQAQHYVDAEKARGKVSADAQKQLDLSRYYEETRELARRLTEWSKGLKGTDRRFVVCSGGGPGIMEAANRGASDARGQSIGLGISLPAEQHPNPYITRELSFEFHYFFMRKFWFSYLAKAMIVMPGGYGTLDEFMEVVTLVQTKKIRKPLPIVFFGKDYWDRDPELRAHDRSRHHQPGRREAVPLHGHGRRRLRLPDHPAHPPRPASSGREFMTSLQTSAI